MLRYKRNHTIRKVCALAFAFVLFACGAPTAQSPTALPTAYVKSLPIIQVSPTLTPTPPTTATAPPVSTAPASPATTRIAVIGDYGWAGENEARVAALVKSWTPDYIITTGDNNYPAGAAETIDANVGQYYHEFIAPYSGSYGEGASENRFFPVLGNHDLQTGFGQPYYDYFTLPGNERYYSADLGHVRMFAINSMPGEPDGITADSPQAAWLKQELGASQACWNVAVMHHPPFTSGRYGPSTWVQWPYAEWGIDLVLSGHDHTYERFEHDGIPYIVNGVGGGALYALGPPIEGSKMQFQGGYGALLIDVSANMLRFQFIALDGTVVDDQFLTGGC